MVAVNPYKPQDIKKQENNDNNVQNNPELNNADHAKKGDNKENKVQNTDVFYNHLDANEQKIIMEAMGQEGNGNVKQWGDPKKIAEALTKAGYEATVGKDGDTTYLEVVGKDGQKYKIWDTGGDNGIGAQDIQFNGQLAELKNDLKNANNNQQINGLNGIAGINGLNGLNGQNAIDLLLNPVNGNEAFTDPVSRLIRQTRFTSQDLQASYDFNYDGKIDADDAIIQNQPYVPTSKVKSFQEFVKTNFIAMMAKNASKN